MKKSLSPSGCPTITGHALIEGVVLRSRHYVVRAVRTPHQSIQVSSLARPKYFSSSSFWQLPFLRGVATFIESVQLGVEGLGYSAQVASRTDHRSNVSSKILLSMGLALLLGGALFIWIPRFLLEQLNGGDGVFGALMMGAIKIGILLLYVYLISLFQDIRRIFQFLGAHHQSMQTFEAGEDLTLENTRRYSLGYPFCLSSLFFILVLISMGGFSILFPHLIEVHLSSQAVLQQTGMIFIRLVGMVGLFGLLYEGMRFWTVYQSSFWSKGLLFPVFLVQKFITRVPEEEHREVALAALRQLLRLEKGIPSPGRGENDKSTSPSHFVEDEFEIRRLEELGRVYVQVEHYLD